MATLMERIVAAATGSDGEDQEKKGKKKVKAGSSRAPSAGVGTIRGDQGKGKGKVGKLKKAKSAPALNVRSKSTRKSGGLFGGGSKRKNGGKGKSARVVSTPAVDPDDFDDGDFDDDDDDDDEEDIGGWAGGGLSGIWGAALKLGQTPRGSRAVRSKSDSLASNLEYRGFIAEELLETERSYLDSLKLCIRVYLVPLRGSVNGPEKVNWITQDDVDKIFGGLETIALLHVKLSQELQDRVDNWDPRRTRIGDLFLRITPYLKTYTDYVVHYEEGVAALARVLNKSKSARKWLDNVQTDLAGGYDLSSFLIQPVQRIPRYQLFLEDLLKHTEETHPDYDDLVAATGQVKSVALYINDRKKELDQIQAVNTIQKSLGGGVNLVEPHRRYMKEGLMTISHPKSPLAFTKGCICYLFNDVLVFGRPNTSLLGRKWKFDGMYPLDDLRVSRLEPATGPPDGATATGDAPDWGAGSVLRVHPSSHSPSYFIMALPDEPQARRWAQDLTWARARVVETKLPQVAGLPAPHVAAMIGRAEFLNTLIDLEPEVLTKKDPAGGTILHIASHAGQESIVKMILRSSGKLRRSVDVNARNGDERTPLHLAVSRGHLRVVRLLLEAGADVNPRGKNGRTPIYGAFLAEYWTALDYLQQNGGDLNIPDSSGWSLIHVAAFLKHRPSVERLVTLGVDINKKTQGSRRSALHYACEQGALDLALYLVLNGAHVKAKDENGETALHIVLSRGGVSFGAVLVEFGARLEVKDRFGRTPLSYVQDEATIGMLKQTADATEEFVWDGSETAATGGARRGATSIRVDASTGGFAQLPNRSGRFQPVTRAMVRPLFTRHVNPFWRPAHWVSDRVARRCMACDDRFWPLIRSKHHCRKCGIVVCGSCSTREFVIPSIVDHDAPVRVCDSCHALLTRLNPPPEAMRRKHRSIGTLGGGKMKSARPAAVPSLYDLPMHPRLSYYNTPLNFDMDAVADQQKRETIMSKAVEPTPPPKPDHLRATAVGQSPTYVSPDSVAWDDGGYETSDFMSLMEGSEEDEVTHSPTSAGNTSDVSGLADWYGNRTSVFGGHRRPSEGLTAVTLESPVWNSGHSSDRATQDATGMSRMFSWLPFGGGGGGGSAKRSTGGSGAGGEDEDMDAWLSGITLDEPMFSSGGQTAGSALSTVNGVPIAYTRDTRIMSKAPGALSSNRKTGRMTSSGRHPALSDPTARAKAKKGGSSRRTRAGTVGKVPTGTRWPPPRPPSGARPTNKGKRR